MTANQGFTLGKQAGALAAALLIGTAILGFSSVQPAYAVVTTPGSGDADSGDQGSSPASRKPKPKPKPQVPFEMYCTLTEADGTITFYEPGTTVKVSTKDGEKDLTCGGPGWIVWRPGLEPNEQAPTGSHSQAP